MTFSDYLLDIALIAVVFRQVRESRFSIKMMVLPLATSAIVANQYLHGIRETRDRGHEERRQPYRPPLVPGEQQCDSDGGREQPGNDTQRHAVRLQHADGDDRGPSGMRHQTGGTGVLPRTRSIVSSWATGPSCRA